MQRRWYSRRLWGTNAAGASDERVAHGQATAAATIRGASSVTQPNADLAKGR